MSFTGEHSIRGHYSEEEEELIREAILSGTVPTCPRCDLQLTSKLPKGGRCARHEVWEFHCEACLQSAIIED
jgi:predicted PP-loop superfamily ATPase